MCSWKSPHCCRAGSEWTVCVCSPRTSSRCWTPYGWMPACTSPLIILFSWLPDETSAWWTVSASRPCDGCKSTTSSASIITLLSRGSRFFRNDLISLTREPVEKTSRGAGISLLRYENNCLGKGPGHHPEGNSGQAWPPARYGPGFRCQSRQTDRSKKGGG